MGTATFVKHATGFHGDAAVYRLDPPYTSTDEDGSAPTEYVVASAVDLPISLPGYRDSETMTFPSDADGNVKSWGELGFAPHKSHEDALKDMGYEVSA